MTDIDIHTLGPEEYIPACPRHGRERIVRCTQTGQLHCACGWRPVPAAPWLNRAPHKEEERDAMKMTPEPITSQLAAIVWQLAPAVIQEVCDRLDQRPETRATIVEAMALAVALIDVRPSRRFWHMQAVRNVVRLGRLWGDLQGHVAAPWVDSLDLGCPAFLGTRGPSNHEAAMVLALETTGYLHVDLALANLPSYGYGQVVVDTLLAVAATLYVSMAQQPLVPPEEQDVGCYQVALWRAYERIYQARQGVTTDGC